MTAPRDERCGGGCTFPTIDFTSGRDDIYVCGEKGHPSRVCLLVAQDGKVTEVVSLRVWLARRVGQAGWWLGYSVSQVGRGLGWLGDRIIDAGDQLAAKVAGR